MDKITEKTLIPLSMLITILGGIFWLSSMWSQTVANASDLKYLKGKVHALDSDVIDRLARIETKLDIMSNNNKGVTDERTRK